VAKSVWICDSLALEVNIPKSAIREIKISEEMIKIDVRRLRRTIRNARKLPVSDLMEQWWKNKLRVLARKCRTYE
jgi:hypothetical protein